MSQVRTGTVDVTNGSQVVTGSGTNWLTSTKINDLFIIQGESVIYRIIAVSSDTQISLSSNYVGTTAAGVAYVIHVDFTASGIPLMQDGDIETVSIYNLAVVALEQGLSSGTYYLGAFTTAPTSTGTGGAITQGMMYFDTSLDLLRVYDGSAWYDGAASANAAAQSAAEAAADAVQTGLDRVQTGLDRVQTVSDAAQTISDAAQTAADRVQTGLDRAQTVSDAAQTVLDAAATAADRAQTGLDSTATAADRVDVNDVETRVLAIEVSINNTFDTFDDRFLGTFAVDPTVDNSGDPISVGAVYYNSVQLATKFYNGSTWDDPSQSASTSATNALNSENAAAASALDASTSASEALASEGAASTSESNAASSAADALASFNEFVDIYHGALSSAPTTNLNAGDLYFDIPTSAMRVYDGALWRAVTTVVEGVYAVAEYTNIATQTTITTAYDVGLVQVLYNGVQLNLGDFTATNGTSIVLAVAVASATDVITVIRWGAVTTSTFLGTAATKNTGVTTGTIPFAEDVVLVDASGNADVNGILTADGLTVGGTGTGDGDIALKRSSDGLTVGNVTVDSVGSRLVVDTAYSYIDFETEGTNFGMRINNGNCGIGTSNPATKLHITKDGNQSAVLDAYEAQQVSHNTIAYTRWVQNASGIANIMGVDSSAGILGTSSNHPLSIRTNNTTAMTIGSTGNVGIGTSFPNGRLGVTGGTTNASTLLTAYDNAAVTIVPKSTSGYSLAIGSGPSDFPYLQMSASGTAPNALNLNPYGGNIGIGTSSPAKKVEIAGNNQALASNTTLRFTDTDTTTQTDQHFGKIEFNSLDSSAVSPDRAYITAASENSLAGSYISFGTSAFTAAVSEKLRIDGMGNIGIGTNSASDKLTLSNGQMRMSDNYGIRWGDASAGIYGSGADENLRIVTSGSERLRIDSSGSLLVGTTDTSLWNDNADNYGHNILANGQYYSSTNGEINAYLNRQNSDGAILAFAKDGTTVGSWMSRASAVSSIILDPRANESGFGIGTTNSTSLVPTNNTGALVDNSKDLGEAATRWKDLHLSGGVVFGDAGGSGTNTSNTLDSYEEGTFTPVFGGGTSTTTTGTYTKVGNMVTVFVNFTASDLSGSSGSEMTGLPFVSSRRSTTSALAHYNLFGYDSVQGLVLSSQSKIVFIQSRANTSWLLANFSNGSGRDIHFTCTYDIT